MPNLLLILACGVELVAAHDLQAKSREPKKLELDSSWYEDSHHEGKPWNLDRINGKLDGDDDTENNGKGVNIFVRV